MPATAAIIGGGANLLGGLVKGLVGSGQKRQGKRMLKNLQYPTETLPSEITENQKLAKQQSATGLPSEQYRKAMQDIQRNQLVALRGAHDRRGGIGAISGIQQGTNDATLNLNAQDAQMKLANQRNFMNVNNQVAGWKSKLFDVNTRNKYSQDRAYAMGLLGAGNTNLYAGIDQGIGGAGSLGYGLFGDPDKMGYNYGNTTDTFNPPRQGFNSSGYATGVF